MAENAGAPALTVVPFADGSGQIGIADGWTAQTLTQGVANLHGPGGALVLMGGTAALVDPRGETYQALARLGVAQRLELVVPYSDDPAQAFLAANRAIKMQHGKPDPQTRVESVTPVGTAGGASKQMTISGTEMSGTKLGRFRALVTLQPPAPGGGWSMSLSVMSAPDATFARDEPVMTAMFDSYSAQRAARASDAAAPDAAAGNTHAAAADTHAAAAVAHVAAQAAHAGAPESGAAAAAGPALTTVPFPDGTGSVGVAPGWSAVRLGAGSAVLIRPDGAEVMLGLGIQLFDPSGSAYRTYQQYAQRGMPSPPILVAPYSADPAQAFVALNRAAKLQTGDPDPQTHVVESRAMQGPPGFAVAYIDATATVKSTLTRVRGTVFVNPPAPDGSWMMTVNLVSAADATFADDEPALKAMFGSYALNADARGKQVAATQASAAADLAKAAATNTETFERSMKDAKGARARNDKSVSDFIAGTFGSDG